MTPVREKLRLAQSPPSLAGLPGCYPSPCRAPDSGTGVCKGLEAGGKCCGGKPGEAEGME